MAYAILRAEKSKSMADVGSRAAHNHRSTSDAAPRADPAKRGDNDVLIGPKTAEETVALVRAKLEQVPKIRKNANLAIELVLTTSPEFFETATMPQKRAWRDASLAWLRSTWGADNLVSAVLHLDEATPHIQVLLVPMHEGKLTSAHWMDGPAKMAKLQDGYFEAVKHLGLKRGEKHETPVEHQPVRDFYRAAERARKGKRRPRVQLPVRGPLGGVSAKDWAKLERDVDAQNQRLEDLEALRAGQLDRRKLEHAQAQLNRLSEQIAEANTKLAKLTEDVERASGLLSSQRNEFNGRDVQISKLDAAIVERTARLAELDARIQKAEKHLAPPTPAPTERSAPRSRPRG